MPLLPCDAYASRKRLQHLLRLGADVLYGGGKLRKMGRYLRAHLVVDGIDLSHRVARLQPLKVCGLFIHHFARGQDVLRGDIAGLEAVILGGHRHAHGDKQRQQQNCKHQPMTSI